VTHISTTAKVAITALVAVLLAGIAVVTSGGADAATTSARVTRWVDGDTVETTRGTIRLIGIDTPERGSCGYAAASRHAQAIAPVGSRVRVGNPTSVVNHDQYGRNLRYVLTVAGRDVGMAQIKNGARARYDGRDGYQWHPRQSAYHRADANHGGYGCTTGGTGGSTGGSTVPVGGDCPPGAPIKGNADSMIYHLPGQAYYDITSAEECFATETQAVAAGYRAAKI
jgi:endonuclease YncB( thermonuclease family)